MSYYDDLRIPEMESILEDRNLEIDRLENDCNLFSEELGCAKDTIACLTAEVAALLSQLQLAEEQRSNADMRLDGSEYRNSLLEAELIALKKSIAGEAS